MEYFGRKEIWLADGDGTNLRQLYAGPADILSEPRWSPGGTAIVCSIGLFDDAGTTFTERMTRRA